MAALAKGRAVAAGVSLADEPRLQISVQCRDAETADRLRNFFRERLTDPGTRTRGEGDWAMLDTRVDPQSGFAKLKQLLDEN